MNEHISKNKFFMKVRKDAVGWFLLLPTLLFFTVFAWQPLVSTMWLSFYEVKGYTATKFIGLQNYIDAVTNSSFQQALINTFYYVIWSLILGFLVPLIIAIIINEMRHFKSFFKFSIFFPVMVPPIAAALLWTVLFDANPSGILNQLLSLFGLAPSQWLQDTHYTIILIVVTMIWKGFGSTAIFYLASLQGVNHELYEAAAIDGAGIWKRVRNITFPQISSIISIMFILQIIGVFQIFQEPLTMTDGGPNNASTTLMLQSYYDGFRFLNVGRSLAISTISFLILAGLSIVYFTMNKNSDEE
jgi:multiple sugar transport system permease protein